MLVGVRVSVKLMTRTHDTLLSRQSALPTELPGQLSRQGSKSTTQHNTRQSQTPILNTLCYGTENPHLICTVGADRGNSTTKHVVCVCAYLE